MQRGLPLAKLSDAKCRRQFANRGARHFRAQLAGRLQEPNHPGTESKNQINGKTFLCFSAGMIPMRNEMRKAARFCGPLFA
jgi:hypothetical protein